MLFKQLRDIISSLSCHADTSLDHILTQMDKKVISDKKLRKAVAKVKEEKLEIVGDRGNKLVKAEFAAIAVAHNRKETDIGLFSIIMAYTYYSISLPNGVNAKRAILKF